MIWARFRVQFLGHLSGEVKFAAVFNEGKVEGYWASGRKKCHELFGSGNCQYMVQSSYFVCVHDGGGEEGELEKIKA